MVLLRAEKLHKFIRIKLGCQCSFFDHIYEVDHGMEDWDGSRWIPVPCWCIWPRITVGVALVEIWWNRRGLRARRRWWLWGQKRLWWTRRGLRVMERPMRRRGETRSRGSGCLWGGLMSLRAVVHILQG